MTASVPANVNAAVTSVAQQYGVPAGIWQDVAYVESGYNTNAVGDNGTSFGLFQLHIGGQLPAQYNSNPQAVFDPSLNAKIAMPAISQAWNNLKGSFNPNSAAWWQQFAAQSGHPGGSPGNSATVNEAAKLQANYSGDPLQSAIQGAVAGAATVSTGSAAVGTSAADASSGVASLISNINNIQASLPSVFIRIGLFLGALVLLVAGFVLVKKSI